MYGHLYLSGNPENPKILANPGSDKCHDVPNCEFRCGANIIAKGDRKGRPYHDILQISIFIHQEV
jgi:hypothetical protein